MECSQCGGDVAVDRMRCQTCGHDMLAEDIVTGDGQAAAGVMTFLTGSGSGASERHERDLATWRALLAGQRVIAPVARVLPSEAARHAALNARMQRDRWRLILIAAGLLAYMLLYSLARL